MVSLNQSLFGAIQQTQSTLFNINTLLSEVYKPRELSQPVTAEEMTQRLSLLQTEKQQAQSESNNNESNNGENKTDSSGMNNDNGEGSNNMML